MPEKLGVPRRPRLTDLVNQALGHISQWFITKSFRNGPDADPAASRGQYYIQPFMVGLTMEALIMFQEATGDARALPNVKVALDWLWANAWVPADQAFWYENMVADPSLPFPQRAGSPDLNLLIAPAYAWYYKMTGDTIYRDRGDQAFEGGVKKAYLWGANSSIKIIPMDLTTCHGERRERWVDLSARSRRFSIRHFNGSSDIRYCFGLINFPRTTDSCPDLSMSVTPVSENRARARRPTLPDSRWLQQKYPPTCAL